jgi:hypothetical protein
MANLRNRRGRPEIPDKTVSFICDGLSQVTSKSGRAADAYEYSPLSEHGSIRLIRLMGHKDKGAPKLFEYPLQELGQGAHLYEVLSYVWGSEEDKQPINIQEPDGKDDTSCARKTRRLHIIKNLYAALLHLRNRLLDRVL